MKIATSTFVTSLPLQSIVYVVLHDMMINIDISDIANAQYKHSDNIVGIRHKDYFNGTNDLQMKLKTRNYKHGNI